MELITVEPLDGSELERLITALLNASGVVHNVTQTTGLGPDADAERIMDAAPERLHCWLAELSEHYDDDELAFVTGILAWITVIVADDLGIGSRFRCGPDCEQCG